MFEYDAVIVGGGPAGLTAGLHLSRAGFRALVLEKELFGGNLQHTHRVDDYPAFRDGISGAQLAAEMIEQASAAGVKLDQAEVSAVELFSRSRWVACSDGRGFSCGVVILAGGSHFKRLGIPGEKSFVGRGVIDCTPCDGGFFVGRPVVVFGSNEYALRDAAYLTGLGAHVTVISDDEDELRVTPREVIVRRGMRLDSIIGRDRVEAVVCVDRATQQHEQLAAAGVAIRVGLEPATDWLDGLVDLDEERRIAANALLETSTRYVLAAGDIRSGTPQRVAAAVGDGAIAAAHAAQLLAAMK